MKSFKNLPTEIKNKLIGFWIMWSICVTIFIILKLKIN